MNTVRKLLVLLVIIRCSERNTRLANLANTPVVRRAKSVVSPILRFGQQ
jgi:hypothetical protein